MRQNTVDPDRTRDTSTFGTQPAEAPPARRVAARPGAVPFRARTQAPRPAQQEPLEFDPTVRSAPAQARADSGTRPARLPPPPPPEALAHRTRAAVAALAPRAIVPAAPWMTPDPQASAEANALAWRETEPGAPPDLEFQSFPQLPTEPGIGTPAADLSGVHAATDNPRDVDDHAADDDNRALPFDPDQPLFAPRRALRRSWDAISPAVLRALEVATARAIPVRSTPRASSPTAAPRRR